MLTCAFQELFREEFLMQELKTALFDLREKVSDLLVRL